MEDRKAFYKQLILLAVPITIQSMVSASVNVADVFMIGKLGASKLAALGLANQTLFIMTLILYGVNSGAAVFMSQFWGKKDYKNIHKVLGVALIGSVIVSMIFFILAQTIPEKLMRVYTLDKEIIRVGATYLKIVSFGYIIMAISFAYSVQLRCVGFLKLGAYTSLISLVVNVLFNYGFIFGNFGLPELGIRGAAIATVIARVIEIIIIMTVVYVKKYPLASKISELFQIEKTFLKKMALVTLPIVINEMLWAFGITGYNMVYGRMGIEAVAVVGIVGSISNILFTMFWGVASATAVMIGNKIGENKEEEAIKYGFKLGKISFILGLLVSVLLVITIKPILGFYDLDDKIYWLVVYTIYALAILAPFKSYTATTIVGILRGGGDVNYSLILDITALWLVGIPAVIYSGLYLKLPIFIVFGIAGSEEVIKFIFSVKRVVSKKWIKNLIEDM